MNGCGCQRHLVDNSLIVALASSLIMKTTGGGNETLFISFMESWPKYKVSEDA